MGKRKSKNRKIYELGKRINRVIELGGDMVIPSSPTSAQLRKLDKDIRKFHANIRKEKSDKLLLDKINRFNLDRGEKSRINLSKYGISKFKGKDRDKLVRKINIVISKKRVNSKEKEKLENIIYSKLSKRDKKEIDSKTKNIGRITRKLEDRIRKNKGMEYTSLQEQYYKNFLYAAIRTGNRTMYEEARKRGVGFVLYLLKEGWEINDMYRPAMEDIDEGVLPQYMDKEIIDSLGEEAIYNFSWGNRKNSHYAKSANKDLPKGWRKY